ARGGLQGRADRPRLGLRVRRRLERGRGVRGLPAPEGRPAVRPAQPGDGARRRVPAARPGGLAVRLRLTLVFGCAMAVVLAVLGGFLSCRLGADLRDGVDLGLRPRAAVLVAALDRQAPAELDEGRVLIDEDEAFAQILAPDGSIVDTTPAVAGAPMLGPAQ